MKYPKTLKIGAHTYKLIFASHWDDNDGELAKVFHDRQEIYIQEGLSETQTFQCLFHEAFHVINAQVEHDLLESLSEQFSQFLLDNKLVKL